MNDDELSPAIPDWTDVPVRDDAEPDDAESTHDVNVDPHADDEDGGDQ